MAGLGEPFLQGVEDLGAGAHRLGEALGADRHHHEFLDVDRVVGVRAAVDDVHHRHRQRAGRDAADVAVERGAEALGRGLGGGEAGAEDGVGAEAALVGGAVERDQRVVDADLVGGGEPGQRVADRAVDRLDGAADALAAVAAGIAIAQLHRLVGAGRGAGRDRGAAHGAVLEQDVDLDGRIASAVEDLAAHDINDDRHLRTLPRFASPLCDQVLSPKQPEGEPKNSAVRRRA